MSGALGRGLALAMVVLACTMACGDERSFQPERELIVPDWLAGPWTYVSTEGGDIYHLSYVEFLDDGQVLASLESCFGSDTGESPPATYKDNFDGLTWQWGPDESVELLVPADAKTSFLGLRPFPLAGRGRFVSRIPGVCDRLAFHELGEQLTPELWQYDLLESGRYCYPASCVNPRGYAECSDEARVCE